MRLINVVIFLLVGLFSHSQGKLIYNTPVKATVGDDYVVGFDTLYYYILGGQSNMAGRAPSSSYSGNYTGLIGAGSKKVYTKNYILNPSVFEQLETGVNSSDQSNQAGIQPNLGYDLCNYKGRDIYFIQAAQGGQPISVWASSSSMGTWLDSTITLVQSRAIQEGKRVIFKGFVWIQGETGGGTDTAAYHTALSALIARVRILSDSPNLPTYIVQMKDCQSAVTGLTALQEVQEDVAGETNNHLVGKNNTPPNTCAGDNLHFSYDTYVAIANYIFNLIKDL